MSTPVAPRLAVVIAAYNEAGNVGPVCEEAIRVLAELEPFEIVVVDDGSSDATAAELSALADRHPPLRALRHERNSGKTMALRTGITAARAPWIATMDADGQNDPRDILSMFRAAIGTDGIPPLVAGVRARRMDTLSRKLASRLSNAFRRAVLNDDCPDTGCGLKLFRREDFLRLPGFEGMHRFLPALFQAYGLPLVCVKVADRARISGHSKYTNFGRAVVGIADVLGVVWLRRRTRLPGGVTAISGGANAPEQRERRTYEIGEAGRSG